MKQTEEGKPITGTPFRQHLIQKEEAERFLTPKEFLNGLIKQGIIKRWEKIDDANYKIEFLVK